MDFLLSFASPENMKSIVLILLALFAKDTIVAALRRLERRFLTDKDPKNDALGELAGATADGLEKMQIPGKK